MIYWGVLKSVVSELEWFCIGSVPIYTFFDTNPSLPVRLLVCSIGDVLKCIYFWKLGIGWF